MRQSDNETMGTGLLSFHHAGETVLSLNNNLKDSSSELKVRRSIAQGFNHGLGFDNLLRAESTLEVSPCLYRTQSFLLPFDPGLKSRAFNHRTSVRFQILNRIENVISDSQARPSIVCTDFSWRDEPASPKHMSFDQR